MYCSQCGNLVSESDNFCSECGNTIRIIPEKIEYDNRYIWALATVPIVFTCLLEIFFPIGKWSVIIAIILNAIFMTLDSKALAKQGIDAEKWVWSGMVLVPLYLFLRASKTDRNYAYAIVWCVMFTIDLFI